MNTDNAENFLHQGLDDEAISRLMDFFALLDKWDRENVEQAGRKLISEVDGAGSREAGQGTYDSCSGVR